jgi:hypothetical protein
MQARTRVMRRGVVVALAISLRVRGSGRDVGARGYPGAVSGPSPGAAPGQCARPRSPAPVLPAGTGGDGGG